MNAQTDDNNRPAVAGPVERQVRPVAWMVRQGRRTYYVSDSEFIRSSYDTGEFVPLYGPDALEDVRERTEQPVAWIRHDWSGSGERHLSFDGPPDRRPVRDEVVNPIWIPLVAMCARA